MLRFRTVLIGVVVVLVAAVSPPAPAGADGAAVRGDRRRPITAVTISGPFGGIDGPSLSSRGHVLFTDRGASQDDFQPYRWFEGEVTPLPPDLPEDRWAFGTAMNDRGEALVATAPYRQSADEYFISTGDVMTPVPLDMGEGSIHDIDNAGRLLLNRWENGRARAGFFDGRREITSPLTVDGRTVWGLKVNDRRDVLAHLGDLPFGRAFLWPVGRDPVDLGTLGGDWSMAIDVNDSGSVFGVSADAAGDHHPFLWRSGRMTDLGTLGGRNDRGAFTPGAINGHDQIVGTSPTGAGQWVWHAYLWTEGRMRDLGTLGGSYSTAYDVNDWGEVVGESETASGAVHAFLWRNGVMTDLGALIDDERSFAESINNRGQVLGRSMSGELNEVRVVLWETRNRG
jgi:probable HAF family extracellular repeat protein